MEDRVAELESILRRDGLGPRGKKRKIPRNEGIYSRDPQPLDVQTEWRWGSSPASSEHIPEPSSPITRRVPAGSVVDILQDLSTRTSISHDGATTRITMGSMISSIIQARNSASGVYHQRSGVSPVPESPKPRSSALPDAQVLSQIPADIAEKVSCSTMGCPF